VTFYDFLSLKNDVNVPSKSPVMSKIIKGKQIFFVGVLKTNSEKSRIWSWIH
jgi:hypothetical protein